MPPKKSTRTSESTSDPSRVYNAGDIVLAKIKGYPAWPGQVIEHDKAPPKVAKEKPKGKNIALIQFFPTGDYAWTASRDISTLTSREIDAYVSGSKKKGSLLEGYKIAQNPQEWNQQKADAQAEYEELMAQAAEDEDELASEEEGAKGKGKDKKRKRASEVKKPEGKKKDSKAGAKKGKKEDGEPASKKAKTSGSDEGAEQVKTWRHKLQKVFLGKSNPAADEMPKCAEFFDAMEACDMKKEWLQESKLNKVLKRITLMQDDAIPDEDKHSFRPRAIELLKKWSPLLNGTESSPKPAEGASDEAAAPAENGDEKEDDAAEAKADDAAAADEEKADADAAEEKKDDEKMDVEDEAPKENGDAKEDNKAADADEKKEDAAESS
ncbi:hypothetical protein JCM8547_008394 [Rhodosporidiobolus lusitaniae]